MPRIRPTFVRSPGPRRGVSFLELMIVVTLVGVLSTVGSMYYNNLINTAKEERCRIDCRTLVKAIQKLESDTKVSIRPPDPSPGTPGYNYPFTGMHPYMDPRGVGVNEPNGFTLDKLLDFRIMASLPDDAFGFPYLVDVPGGTVFSAGPDGLPETGDEIRIALRPPFEALKATFLDDRRTIEVNFSRKIDPFSLFFAPPDTANSLLTLNFPASVLPFPITTVVRDISNPFAALIRLSQKAPVPTPGQSYAVVTQLRAPDRQVRAMDAAELLSQVTLPVTTF